MRYPSNRTSIYSVPSDQDGADQRQLPETMGLTSNLDVFFFSHMVQRPCNTLCARAATVAPLSIVWHQRRSTAVIFSFWTSGVSHRAFSNGTRACISNRPEQRAPTRCTLGFSARCCFSCSLTPVCARGAKAKSRLCARQQIHRLQATATDNCSSAVWWAPRVYTSR